MISFQSYKKIFLYLVLFIFFILSITIVGNYYIKRNKVQELLQIKDSGITAIEYFSYSSNLDFICPKTIYIKFKASKNVLVQLLSFHRLKSYKQDVQSVIHYEKFFWNMKTHSTVLVKGIRDENLKWWNPTSNTDFIYSGFFSLVQKDDSRISVEYDNICGTYFVIIECPAM